MAVISDFILSVPTWIWAGGIILLLVISGTFTTLVLIRNKKFRKELHYALETNLSFREHFSQFYVKTRSRILVRMAREKSSVQYITLSGLGDIWISEFIQHPKEKTLKLILEFVPELGLFKALNAAIQKPPLVKLILEKTGEVGMRTLALSCSGENFDGKAFYRVLEDHLDEIREIAGDPEWNARYFSIKILLEDGSDRSIRPVIDSMTDSHPLIRKTVLLQVENENVENLYGKLESSLIHDAAFEVREAAWKRIQRDFPDMYTVNLSKLSTTEALHVLDFLDSSNDQHGNLAIELLKQDNLELRHPAAVFLQKTGWLEKTLNEAEFSDTADLDRRFDLLFSATQVHIIDFLNKVAQRPASLYLSLRLLESTGDSELLVTTVEKALNGFSYEQRTLWEQAVKLLNLRVSPGSVTVLMKEIDHWKYHGIQIRYLLDTLTVPDNRRIATLLIGLLKDEKFTERNSLILACSRMNVAFLLPDIKEILRSSRSRFTHGIRIDALKILATYKLPYLIQMILELLPTLPLNEAREFAHLLRDFGGKDFSQRVDELLDQPDGKIRAAIIASVPLDEKKRIVKIIRGALKDAEPDVRIAAVWALIEIEETKTINQSLDLLRDPVDKVREAAAKAMGIFGSESTLTQLQAVILNENEVDSVRMSAILGMGQSDTSKSVELLIDLLSRFESTAKLNKSVLAALSTVRSTKRITYLLDHLKDADPELREKIVPVFVLMGQEAENPVKELLAEDLLSIKPYLVEILEKTGFIETMIRKLGNRNPQIRKDAADFLAKVGSLSAFRGIVLAARDPDEDVRVQVTRALEYLSTEKGKVILQELQQDPQLKVRKYTAWALQRMQARTIKDE